MVEAKAAILNVWFWNGPDHSKSEPKMADHTKTDCLSDGTSQS